MGNSLLLSSGDQVSSSDSESLSDVVGSLGNESNLLHGPNGVVGNELSELGGSEDGSVVVESLSLGVVSLQRVVPVHLVSTVGKIVLDED